MGSALRDTITDTCAGILGEYERAGMIDDSRPGDWCLSHLQTDKDVRVIADCELVAIARKSTIGIPHSMQHASFSTYQGLTPAQQEPARKVCDWLDAWRPGCHKNSLALIGPTGTGKTHLAISAVKKMVGIGLAPKFVDYRRLLIDLTGSGWDSDPVGDWASVDVLLVDDFGCAKATTAQGERMAAILALRMNDMRPTVITTNESFGIAKVTGKLASSEKYLDDRLLSRMSFNYQFIAMGDLLDWRTPGVRSMP